LRAFRLPDPSTWFPHSITLYHFMEKGTMIGSLVLS
jgi:hypothetical protein